MVEWKKSVGDEVSEDEVVAVIETDKVTVDVRSTHVGVVVKLFAAVDDVVSFFLLSERQPDNQRPNPPSLKLPALETGFRGCVMVFSRTTTAA